MDIARHIEILLLTNDCVVVPGFGAFMTQYVAARRDEADGSFLPPKRTLGFNPQVKHNDSLLVQSYAEACDISYPEAMGRVEADVEALRRTIETDGDATLDGIGTLSLNGEGSLEFEPLEAGVLTPELYGLDAFRMPLIHAATLPADEGQKGTGRRRWLVPLRYVAAAAVAAVAFFFIPSPVDNGTRQPSQMAESAVLGQLLPRHIDIKATSTRLVAPRAKAAKPQTEAAQPKAEPAKPAQPAEAEQPKPFTIVLASHVSRSNGEDLVRRLHSEGMDGVRIHEGRSSIKVVNGAFATRREAQDSLNRLRQDDRFADAWVLELNV